MTAVQQPAVNGTGRAVSAGRGGVLPPPGPQVSVRQRRPLAALAFALVVALCALVIATMFAGAGQKAAVVVTARDVPVGHTLGRDDLTTARISTGAVAAIPAARLSGLVGKVAAVGLVKGQLLSAAMVSDRPPVTADQALVGVLVKPGQLPGGLAAGDTVMVAVLAPTGPGAGGSRAAAPTVLVPAAPVASVEDAAAGGGTVVSVRVPRASAGPLLAASSAGLVALAKVTQ